MVLTMDLHGHGNSESLPQDQLYEGAVGVDGAVQLIASLPYVDTERIGVTGHSSGGTAANMALPTDNEREKPLIAAILHQAADWQDDTGGDHSGEYGSRSVGIIASEYDDFYFGTYAEDEACLQLPENLCRQKGQNVSLTLMRMYLHLSVKHRQIHFMKEPLMEKTRNVLLSSDLHSSGGYIFIRMCRLRSRIFRDRFGAPNPLPATDKFGSGRLHLMRWD